MKSLGELIADLEITCALLEDLETIPNEVVDIFQDLKGAISDKVDSWIGRLEAMDVALEHARKKRDAWDKRVQVIKSLQEKAKTYLAFHMQQTALPELKGSDGRLKLYKNSQPRLDMKLPVAKASYQHALNPFLFGDMLNLYPEFFQEVKLLNVDTDSIKKSLQAGRKLDFAGLEQGFHVRILL